MSESKISPGKVAALFALSLGGGLVGTLIGTTYGAALNTEPAWVGPAILVGSIGLALVGVLSLPAAIRARRRKSSGPVA